MAKIKVKTLAGFTTAFAPIPIVGTVGTLIESRHKFDGLVCVRFPRFREFKTREWVRSLELYFHHTELEQLDGSPVPKEYIGTIKRPCEDRGVLRLIGSENECTGKGEFRTDFRKYYCNFCYPLAQAARREVNENWNKRLSDPIKELEQL